MTNYPNFLDISKVYILFWDGHKILRNLHLTFDWHYISRTKVRWRFRKILWPSQNILTLTILKALITKVFTWYSSFSSISLFVSSRNLSSFMLFPYVDSWLSRISTRVKSLSSSIRLFQDSLEADSVWPTSLCSTANFVSSSWKTNN